MKTFFNMKYLLLTCALYVLGGVFGSNSAWAEEVTFDFSTESGLQTLGITPPTSDNTSVTLGTSLFKTGVISFSATNGTSTSPNKVYYTKNGFQARIYSKSVITLKADDAYLIKGITITAELNSKKTNLDKVTASVGTFTGTSAGTTGTWAGSANTVDLTLSAQVRIDSIVVTYAAKSTSVLAPTITNTDKYFSESFTTSITNNEDGSTIYYTIDGSEPSSTNGSTYSNGVTISSESITSGTKVTLKAIAINGDDASDVVSQVYTYAPSVSSISALKSTAKADEVYTLTFNNVRVTEKNGSKVYMQDADAGIVYYNSSDAGNYTDKNVLNGTAVVTYGVNQGLNEIISIEGNLTKTTTEEEVPCTTVYLKTLLDDMEKYESQRVKIEMAYVTTEFGDYEATLTDDGENTITLYKAKGTKFADAKQYAYIDVEGYPLVFKKDNTSDAVNELQVYAGDISADAYTESISISKYGYSTLFNADAIILPEGMSAYTVTAANDSKLTFSEYASGSTVPAKTGVVVKGTASAEYTYQLSADPTEAPTDNLLHGATTAGTTNAGDGSYKYYMLSAKDSKIGFYYGAADGAAFTSAAKKAYLAIPSTMSVAQFEGFSFDDLGGNVTGISSAANDAAAPSVAYDLNGRRVNLGAAQKGVYVVNGKKVLVK
jgi:hypothetical protein